MSLRGNVAVGRAAAVCCAFFTTTGCAAPEPTDSTLVATTVECPSFLEQRGQASTCLEVSTDVAPESVLFELIADPVSGMPGGMRLVEVTCSIREPSGGVPVPRSCESEFVAEGDVGTILFVPRSDLLEWRGVGGDAATYTAQVVIQVPAATG